MTEADNYWMKHALELAKKAAALGEVPVGAVLVSAEGEILGEGWNGPISRCDPTAHAEIQALRQAAEQVNNYRLPGCTLYVSLEPCLMCAGALVHSRVERLVFAAREPKAGCIESQLAILDAPHLNHRVRWEGGVQADAAAALLSNFFSERRRAKREAKGAEESRD